MPVWQYLAWEDQFMARRIIFRLFQIGSCAIALSAVPALAKRIPSADVVCSYAPSQSKSVLALVAAAGGASGALAAVSQAAGLSVVAHSSGAAILTGAGGYLGGTIGAAAASGPAIVTVGLAVGGAAISVELLCASRNHPAQVKKVEAAANEFRRRVGAAYDQTQSSAMERIKSAGVSVKRVAGDVYEYAYRKAR